MNRKFAAAAALLTALLLGACGASDPSAGAADAADAAAVTISLSGESAKISGSGASEDGGVVTIQSGGTYALTGDYAGRIVVNAAGEDVTLRLSSVSVISDSGPAVEVTAAGSVTIEAESGTENSLTLAEEFQPADGEADAAVCAKSDLTLTGEGTLAVSGGVRDGVNCRGSLTISSLALRVDAADDGIVGKSSVTAGEDAQITVTSGGDGIKATEDTDAALGFVALGAGRYSITAGNDGVQAETALTVSGGEYTITSGGGAAAAASLDEDGSYKGLKAGTTLAVTEGDLALDCADDALHADCVELSGGALCIASGDDGVHADSALTVSGGTIDISESYEGLEGETVTITGGTIALSASDDGINCAGGADASGFGGMFGGGFGGASGDFALTIAGGSVYIEAGGDGLDSNGSIVMTGGAVTVFGPTDDANGSIDYETTFDLSGGTLIAAGSSGMAEGPSDSSAQNSLAVWLTSAQESAEVVITDESGARIASFTPSCAFSWVLFSSPDIETGKTYTVTVGGAEAGSATAEGGVTTIGTARGFGGFGGGPGGGTPQGGQAPADFDPDNAPADFDPDNAPTRPDGQAPADFDPDSVPTPPDGQTPPDGAPGEA